MQNNRSDLLMKITTQKHELSFEWYKSPAGYKWEDCEPCNVWGEPINELEEDRRRELELLGQPIPEGPYLTEINPRFRPVSWTPLENPLLFAHFADIQPNEEAFLNWANEHGRLINVKADFANPIFIFPRYIPFDETDVDFQRNRGMHLIERDGYYYRRANPDPLMFWIQEYRDLSFAVMLWELALGKDPRLDGILEWNNETSRVYVNKIWKEKLAEIDFERFGKDKTYHPRCGAVRDRIYDLNSQPLRKGDSFDTVKAAFVYIRQEINRKLRQYPLNVLFKIETDGELHKTIEPSSLLSAMWYQFYLVQAGEITLRRCALCGKWENMEGHRSTWSRHANCAGYDRLKRARNKKRGNVHL